MKKTLILVGDKRKYFWPLISNDNDYFDVDTVYKEKYRMFPLNLRRKIPKLTYYKFGKLGEWYKKIQNYDRLIIFDSAYSKQLDNIIENYDFENGCFFFYWNKMHANSIYAKTQIENINPRLSIYSFNLTDCQRYGVSYNSQFYYPTVLGEQTFFADVCFCGAAKSDKRIKQLDAICEILNDLKVVFWFHVFACGGNYIPQNFELTNEEVDYSEYLYKVINSRVILDIDIYEEKSCSLRAMEALFYDKKYITNNVNIIEEKFYNPNNIFIIGRDKVECLRDFIYSKVTPVSEEIKNYYLIDRWIRRFE